MCNKKFPRSQLKQNWIMNLAKSLICNTHQWRGETVLNHLKDHSVIYIVHLWNLLPKSMDYLLCWMTDHFSGNLIGLAGTLKKTTTKNGLFYTNMKVQVVIYIDSINIFCYKFQSLKVLNFTSEYCRILSSWVIPEGWVAESQEDNRKTNMKC